MRPLVLTPGPTKIRKKVLKELSRGTLSSDVDSSFFDQMEVAQELLLQLIAAPDHQVVILAGEGMVALDAALANFLTPTTRLLVLDNGIFGAGFAELAKPYTKQVTVYSTPYEQGIGLAALATFLEQHRGEFDVATLVAVDTPTGVKNDVDAIARLLKSHAILSIVDAVAALGGEEIAGKDIDVLLGASQKALSAPVGLAFVYLSPLAIAHLSKRVNPIPYYFDFRPFLNREYPYTFPRELLAALVAALKTRTSIEEHAYYATAVRHALTACQFPLFLAGDWANTVTAFYPREMSARAVQQQLAAQKIIVATSLGPYQDQIIRIGHMGANINRRALSKFMKALGKITNTALPAAFATALKRKDQKGRRSGQ